MAALAEPSQVKILLADDDLEILRITRTRLSKRGFHLIEAHDGEEARGVAFHARGSAALRADPPGAGGRNNACGQHVPRGHGPGCAVGGARGGKRRAQRGAGG